MSERKTETRLVMEVKRAGGMAVKFVSPGTNGMPDRLLLFPDGKMAFVEVKDKGQKPRPLQLKQHTLLMNMGFRVYVLDDERQITKIIEEVKNA